MKWIECSAVAIALLALAGCAAPPPVPSGPALVAPDTQDLAQDKAKAFQAGLAAGERLQARRDAAALTTAHAAQAAATAGPVCPAPSLAKTPPDAAAPQAPAMPSTSPMPSYTPGGPAVPVAPAN